MFNQDNGGLVMLKHKVFLFVLVTLFVFSGNYAYSQKSKYDHLAAHERAKAASEEDNASRREAQRKTDQQTYKSIYDHWAAHQRAQLTNRESKTEVTDIKSVYDHWAAHQRAKGAFLAERRSQSLKR